MLPVQSQSFGSLGAVKAWHRTACLLQRIMASLFGVVTFSYVDDFFWISPSDASSGVDAAWIQGLFKSVVSQLLGSLLDPTKDETGQRVVLLGLDVCLTAQASEWRLHPAKATEWLADICEALRSDWLVSSMASKLCGRLSFLNSFVFGRVGRALLRPLIWRQLQVKGSMRLTSRLRSSLRWFGKVLESGLYRRLPYEPPQLDSLAVLYTGAESTGRVSAVLIVGGKTLYWVAQVPKSQRERLHPRSTQIVPFELLAAVNGFLIFDRAVGARTRLLHFIDSSSALI